MTDVDKAAQAVQEMQDLMTAKGLSADKISDATKQARHLDEIFVKLESLGVSREKAFEIIDAGRAAEPQPAIHLSEPTLAEINSKLDDILERLSRIEARFGD